VVVTEDTSSLLDVRILAPAREGGCRGVAIAGATLRDGKGPEPDAACEPGRAEDTELLLDVGILAPVWEGGC